MIFAQIIDKIQTHFSVTKTEINISVIIIFGLTFGYIYNLIFNNNLDEEQIKSINIILDSLEIEGKLKYIGTDLDNNYYIELMNEDAIQSQNKIPIIDIRSASKIEFMKLPIIGEKTATAIVKYRNENGFNSTKDLKNVKGIGKKTYAKIKNYLINFGTNNLQNSYNIETESKGIVLIDLNTALEKELIILNGIGESMAKKIIDYRIKTPFKNIQELMNIKGIGIKKFDKIKNQIKVEDINN